jgi:SAM-dependent methyltransferase
MTSVPSPEGVSDSQAFWDRLTAHLEPDAPLESYGTLTSQRAVVALRDELERAHVFRQLQLTRSARVLDLGGGAGRFALRIAPQVAHLTLVDLSPALLEVARTRAQAEGIANITFVQASAQEFVLSERYDLILIMDVATYLTAAQLDALAERCANALTPGGRLVLKEPVTSDGLAREHRGSDPDVPYLARFRPREEYARVFGRRLQLRYQRPTLAHLIPWFLSGTDGAVEATAAPWSQALLSRARPLLVRADPWLLALELRLRAQPQLARLLSPLPVLHDLYVFEKPWTPADAEPRTSDAAPELSVVVIAYNEELCIAQVVSELARALERAAIDYELVLVDDGSGDGTLTEMRAVAQGSTRIRLVPLKPNRGIGGALRAGFDAALGSFVSWVPADGQIPPEVVIELHRRRHEASMLTTVYTARDDAAIRMLISKSLNALIQLRTGQVAKSGGNYLFARSAWTAYAPAADDSMMLSTAFRHNLRKHSQSIVEVEVAARARVAGRSKVLNPRTIWRTLGALLRIARDGAER